MAIHYCSVQQPWFTLIQNELKTIEGRLNTGRFATFKKGDQIVWTTRSRKTNGRSSPSCVCKIVDVRSYQSFKEMLTKESVDHVLPGIPNTNCGVEVYRQFYTEEREKTSGVLAVHLQVIQRRSKRQSRRRYRIHT